MYYIVIIIVSFVILHVSCSGIFHENTKITYYPDAVSEYFGYSVILNPYGLIVGAPKAKSRERPLIATGLAFNCSLNIFDLHNVSCSPISFGTQGSIYDRYRRLLPDSFYRDDMWFGASIVSLTSGKILVCAPRYTEPYDSNHLLASGLCYLRRQDRHNIYNPLYEKSRLVFSTDGKREEYGEYGLHLNFYAYGQAGMSLKVTQDYTVIIGAPGMLQWTGGVVLYRFIPLENSMYFSKQLVPNTYYTQELGPDDYFGYSVDAGVFEPSGKTLYVGGAPRSLNGFGQVLIFESSTGLKVRKQVKGPQLGSYFGAALCCLDIDGDGFSDLLVGAPNYVSNDEALPYDQGAVFVYMTRDTKTNFTLEPNGYLSGSGESGASFGTAIADLGDLDGDGYKDVAIGAPWENDGTGVVYIYRGSSKGIIPQYVQRIMAKGSMSFGISISAGMDVDNNKCNDLAVGAAISSTVYLYRCVPTIEVHASIRVPDAMNLPHNATGFTALFCISAKPRPLWPHVQGGLKANIVIDPEENRAQISGDSEYTVTITPGNERCDEQTVDVKPTADLSKPITIMFHLEPDEQMKNDTEIFDTSAARISEDSVLKSSFLIQLVRDCGEDMICTPWLVMTLEALDNPYVPGTDTRLGARLTVLNKEEPAYGAKVNITLPAIPIRVPSECSFEDLDMICEIPGPLFRGEDITWEIELEYSLNESRTAVLDIVAELDDPLYNRNISNDAVQELLIQVTPISDFIISGKSFPNTTLGVKREKLDKAENFTFSHYYEITNYGPSDWYSLEASIFLPEIVDLSSPIKGCVPNISSMIKCTWSVPAKVSKTVVVPLRFDLSKHGGVLEANVTLNFTTEIHLKWNDNKMATATTALVLDPAPPIWPLILGIVSGLILLAAIVFALYKGGFFFRIKYEQLRQLQEQAQPLAESSDQGCSTGPPSLDPNESTQELLFEDSD